MEFSERRASSIGEGLAVVLVIVVLVFIWTSKNPNSTTTTISTSSTQPYYLVGTSQSQVKVGETVSGLNANLGAVDGYPSLSAAEAVCPCSSPYSGAIVVAQYSDLPVNSELFIVYVISQ